MTIQRLMFVWDDDEVNFDWEAAAEAGAVLRPASGANTGWTPDMMLGEHPDCARVMEEVTRDLGVGSELTLEQAIEYCREIASRLGFDGDKMEAAVRDAIDTGEMPPIGYVHPGTTDIN